MPTRISREQLLQSMNNDEVSDAILNPVTNTETFLDRVASAEVGALSNISNLLGFVPSVAIEGRESKPYKETKRILKDKSMSNLSKTLELLKVPFSENEYDPMDAILGSGVTEATNEAFRKDKQKLDRRQELGRQYSGGGFGSVSAEMFLATPIMRAGSMRTTTKAMELGLSKVNIAKAVAVDSLRNAGIFGSTEFGLAKLYGRSDEEAVGNAVAASALGLVGSPLVGAGKGIMHSLGSEERAMRKNFEEGGSQAGGGKPPEMDDQDIAFREPKTPKTEAQKSKETVEKVLFKSVEPRVDAGEVIKGQVKVPEVDNLTQTKYKTQQTGREGIKESHLASHQGGATQKASFQIEETKPVLDAKAEVDKLTKIYDTDVKIREAYGQTQAKFKERKDLLEADKLRLRNKYKIDRYKEIAQNESINDTVRKQARDKANELRKRRFDDTFVSDKVKEKATKKFEEQYDGFTTSKNAVKRQKSIDEEYSGFLAKQEKQVDEPMKVSKENLIKAVESKQDKAKMIKAINGMKVKELGKDFDAKNITAKQRRKYPNEVADIENFIFSKMDVSDFKLGKISAEELRYRERRRLEENIVRDIKIEKENATPKIQEILEADNEITKDLEAIGLTRKSSGFTKRKGSSVTGGERRSEYQGDKAELKKIEREAKEIASAKKSREISKKAMEAYKKNKTVYRRGTRGRAGQPVLTKTTMRELQQDVLTIDEILNKTNPIGTKAELEDLRKSAKEFADNKLYDKYQSELGIKSGQRFKKREDIVFKDDIVDASNSMGQLMATLLGSKRLWDKFPTIREDIGEAIGKMGYKFPLKDGAELSRKEWKDLVKPIFMTKTYGQGDRGLIENMMKDVDDIYSPLYGHKPTRREATEFLDFYKKAEEELVPEIRQFEKIIDDMLKKTNKVELEWSLPNGTNVKLNITKAVDGTISVKGRNIAVQVQGATNRGTRAVLPNIIQSLDAFAASKMSAKGIPSTYDAFQLVKGQNKEADKVYKEALVEIADGGVLQSIAKQLDLDTSSLPKRDLPKEDILKSTEALGMEHASGDVVKAKARAKDLSRTLNKEEVMRDFMASGNVRQHNTNQLLDAMVDESRRRTMSKATDKDDVFERQIAMAHQSSVYNKDMAIDAPDGVDAKFWDKVQRNIFNEARAKLEYNPAMKQILQGKRKYVGENGKLIGDDKFSLTEAIQRELRNEKKLKKLRNKEQTTTLETIGKDYDTVKAKVYSWSDTKVLNEDELYAKKTVYENAQPEPQRMYRETMEGTKKYITDQYKETTQSKSFDRLFNLRKKSRDEVEYSSEAIFKHLTKLMKNHNGEEWTRNVFDTDVHSIVDFDKESGKAYMKEFDWVYQRARPYIDQHAKALNDDSQKYGYYLNNASQISAEVGLGKGHDQIIDKLISLKAMTNESWSFLDKHRGTTEFNEVMDLISQVRKNSAENMKSNQGAYVKGFTKEYYGSGKQIVDNKVMWNAEDADADSIIPMSRESKKLGYVTEETKIPYSKFKTREDMLDFATKNQLKVTEHGFRKMQTAELRDEAGRSRDFVRVLTETIHSVHDKIAIRKMVDDVLDEISNEDSLISSKMKDGFVQITMDERNALPYSLQGKVRFVHKDYIDRLMNRKEVRLVREGRDVAGANQQWKIADRILADFVANFKQNVVLKNVSSFKNAILVNQTIGAMAGVSPKKSWKLHSEAYAQIKRNDNLRSHIALRRAKGKPYKDLQRRLEKSELYQMEQLGLSLNQLDGVRGDSSLLAHMLSDFTGNRFDKVANEILLNQKGNTGKFTTSLFSTIDTQGRYTLVKQFMDDGLSMRESVKKANGLFGDMDQMAPVLVEAMDKYGAIPFLKWFTLTTPQLMRLAKDNPKKTALLSVAIYAMSSETEMNFSTVNPIEAVVDFTDNAVSLDYLEAVTKKGFIEPTVRKLTPYIIPNAWIDIDRVMTDIGEEYTLRPGIKRKPYNPLVKDRIGAPWSEDSLDYRGFTQQIIEGNR